MNVKKLIAFVLLAALSVSTLACGNGDSKGLPLDSDGDGWTDAQERYVGTNPYSADTDGDGWQDPNDPNPLDPSIPALIPTATPTPSSAPMPINVTLNCFGVKYAHGGNVQLVVLVSDTCTENKLLIPPVDEGFSMGDFETKEINMRVFHTPSAEGDLKMSILAYHRDQSKTDYLALIDMMEWYYGESINMLKQLVLSMPENDELIGYYEFTGYSDESWGIGEYDEVGVDDLRIWFSVWSDTEPHSISEPSLLPDVRIQSVSIPSQVKSWSYPSHTLTLVNNEEHDITVNWEVHSSVTGDFDDGSVTISGGAHRDVTKWYWYDRVGLVEITYTIFHKGTELDRWSGVLNVIP